MGSNDIFNDLISRGKYTELIELVNNDPTPSDRAVLFKTEALIYLGSFDEASEIVKPLMKNEINLIKIDAIRQKCLIHWSLGELNQANALISEAHGLLETLDESDEDALSVKAHVLHMFGTLSQSTGLLGQSLDYLQQSLAISEKLGNKNRIAATRANLGIVHSYRGDQEKTLENYHFALEILRELGKTGDEALVLGLIGETYWEIGRKDDGINFKIKSLEILREQNNSYRIADALYVLITFLVLQNKMDLAKSYYKELSALNQSSSAYNIDFMTRFCEALILKFSPRVKQKIIAQEIFEELLTEELDFEIRSEILLHLSDLLIDELRTYSEPEVLKELNHLCSQIFQMAMSENNRYLTVEARILQAKMELINTNFTNADKIFAEASELAKSYGIDSLSEKADFERTQLQNDLISWQKMISKGASIKERVDQSKIRDYLDNILSINRTVFQEEGRNVKTNYKSDYEVLGNLD